MRSVYFCHGKQNDECGNAKHHGTPPMLLLHLLRCLHGSLIPIGVVHRSVQELPVPARENAERTDDNDDKPHLRTPVPPKAIRCCLRFPLKWCSSPTSRV